MDQPTEQPVTHEIGKRTYVVADVDPLDVDGVRTVAFGTAAWLVGFLVLLPFYGRLREDGHTWWLWTCLAGFGLGLAGWDYCRRRRRHRLERRAAEAEDGTEDVGPGPAEPLAPTHAEADAAPGAGPVAAPSRETPPGADVPPVSTPPRPRVNGERTAPPAAPSGPSGQKPPFRPRAR